MKVTFILRDFADVFYQGNGTSIIGLLQLPSNLERFERLNRMLDQVTIKVGSSNSFRDRVELNQILRTKLEPTFKLEPRRGYKLATFEFTPAKPEGCGRATRVEGTNSGFMACGSPLRQLDGSTKPYLCAKCAPSHFAHIQPCTATT